MANQSLNCIGFHTDSKVMKWSQFAADRVSQKSSSVDDRFGAKAFDYALALKIANLKTKKD